MTDEEKVKLTNAITALRDSVVKALNEAVDAILEEFVGPVLPERKQ